MAALPFDDAEIEGLVLRFNAVMAKRAPMPICRCKPF